VVAKVALALVRRVVEQLDPLVKQAGRLAAVGHLDFAVFRGEREPVHGSLARLDGLVDFRAGEGEREVDELEGLGDVPVLVVDLLGGFVGDVVSTEDTQRGVHVEETSGEHERLGGSAKVHLP
jgi:hypothetical protein